MLGALAGFLVVSAAAPVPVADQHGFSDVLRTRAGLLVSSADGTVRRADGDDLPVAATTGATMTALAASADGDLVAAVGDGAVTTSRDGGATFAPDPSGGRIHAWAAAFAGRDLLVFDQDGVLWRGRNGAALREVGKRLPARAFGAVFADARRGWVVGEDGMLAVTRDGGESFSLLDGPVQGDKEKRGGLRAPERREISGAVHAGGALYVSSAGGVWRSIDDGKTFEHVFVYEQPRKICVRMSARGAAVAVACTGFETSLYLAADGRTFKPVPVTDSMHLMSVAFDADGGLAAVGAHELFIRATAAGGRIAYRSPTVDEWIHVAEKIGLEERPGGGSLLGTVRDEHGAPIPGAHVSCPGYAEAHPGVARETETAANGEYRLRWPPRYIVLTVRKEGFASVSLQRDAESDGPTRIDVVLSRPVGCSGVVLGPDGGPLGGATVSLSQRRAADKRPWQIAGARTQSNGSFSIENIPPGEYVLGATAPGYGETTEMVRAPAAAVRVRFGAGEIFGTVADARGEPLQAIEVELFRSADRGFGPLARVDVDAGGAYRLRGLSPGECSLVVRTPTISLENLSSEAGTARFRLKPHEGPEYCMEQPVTVGSARLEVPIRFDRQPPITGHVRDRAGAPVGGAVISAQSATRCPAKGTHAADDGSFSLEELDPVTYRVWAGPVRDPHGRSASEPVLVRPGAKLDLVLGER